LTQIVCAFLLTLAISGQGHPLLSCLSLPALLLAIRILPPVRSAVCGALWGASFFVFAARVGVVGATPGSLAALVFVPAAFTFVGACLTRSAVGFSPLLLATAWIGVEYAVAPLGLRFGLLGVAMFGEGAAKLAAGFLGYGFIAFVIAYANGLLLWLLAEACGSVVGPLFVPGITDPGAFVISYAKPFVSRRGAWAERPRAPPIGS